jgi:hypothetical protein
VRKKIHLVGVELEGGWKKTFPNTPFVRDVSVRGEEVEGCPHYGELPSPPLTPFRIMEWIKEHYPDRSNAYCGMHVHVSLKDQRDYAKLMSRHFYDFYLKALEKWAKDRDIKDISFWDRLMGAPAGTHSRFTSSRFQPRLQVDALNKAIVDQERRTHINYCLTLKGTLEFRTLPMFEDPKVAVDGVKCILQIIETYLRKNLSNKKATVWLSEKEVMGRLESHHMTEVLG